MSSLVWIIVVFFKERPLSPAVKPGELYVESSEGGLLCTRN